MTEGILPKNSVVCDRWQIEEKIGKGGFGEVYRCKDCHTNKSVALKLVSKITANPGIHHLNNEAKALRAVQGKKFFTRYYSYRRVLLFDFLVMELLGLNLRELKKTYPNKKFSVDATLSMGRMMLKSVEWLHDAGYLHRDIKPSNFAIGVEERARRVYLIDFGLAKRYVYDSGELCSLRNKTSFKGTSRYASANVLHGKDPGRRDDLISLFYTLVELSSPKLPWKKISGHKELAIMKESYDHSTLIAGFPSTFLQFFEHLNLLDTLEKPDYGLLLSTLETCLRERALNTFDVETNDNIQETDYLSDHSSQTMSSETTITCEITSAYDKDFESDISLVK
ncbi:unnamed protein product [Larinioides sclopetarius]|uniref:Protein kinase domain-containing protein n=1 Tax=Larinioides sclopetarius TaxID=280406 RepID=A0AAV2BL78_9ARAC